MQVVGCLVVAKIFGQKCWLVVAGVCVTVSWYYPYYKVYYYNMLVLVICTSYDSITYYHGLPYLLPTCYSFIAAL